MHKLDNLGRFFPFMDNIDAGGRFTREWKFGAESPKGQFVDGFHINPVNALGIWSILVDGEEPLDLVRLDESGEDRQITLSLN